MTWRFLKVIFFPLWFPVVVVGAAVLLLLFYLADAVRQTWNYIVYGTKPFTPWS